MVAATPGGVMAEWCLVLVLLVLLRLLVAPRRSLPLPPLLVGEAVEVAGVEPR